MVVYDSLCYCNETEIFTTHQSLDCPKPYGHLRAVHQLVTITSIDTLVACQVYQDRSGFVQTSIICQDTSRNSGWSTT